MNSAATWILGLTAVLLVYLFAKADDEYVFQRDRPQPWVPKRQSINYYAWRGPMFVEDFGNFEGANNPKAEIVPTGCTACEIPKYNKTVKGAAQCHRIASDQCRVPTMTSEDGWRHEYWNSQYKMQGPDKLGGPRNFAQIVNNNLSAPNNLKSAQMRSIMGDWFHPRDKVSSWCYAEMYNNCMKETGPR